ncbi:hypothetical protein CDAR_128491 [Caerostris darwini]|uniref:Uncharacterized protein n=1 Tax=Caerostris darwini TaxID=1538125 RepID=A0AAV4PGF6_9ARAC|nr:hypothetical protein CDAR_128491 [Caerostris darwini]
MRLRLDSSTDFVCVCLVVKGVYGVLEWGLCRGIRELQRESSLTTSLKRSASLITESIFHEQIPVNIQKKFISNRFFGSEGKCF